MSAVARSQRPSGLRDVRFITPTALSYGSQTEEPNLDAVEELLASCKGGIEPNGRVLLGSFPSEIRPEHVSQQALKLRNGWRTAAPHAG
ncbi:hypothetical protein [Micromonospora craterilacus]|uniref:hypothetical protein n=1 Tax=Micromonospora craterilacus TaxID=1655439 RepID=UPI001F24D5EB|nr:hypothetical protein [Micromonospora craterilacus]